MLTILLFLLIILDNNIVILTFCRVTHVAFSTLELPSRPQSTTDVGPELENEGPSQVEFCESSLWKKSILKLSCDFDFETVNRIHLDKASVIQKSRRKGGTLCLMEGMSKRWELQNRLDIPKLPTRKRKISINFPYLRSNLPQFVHSTSSYVYPSNHYLVFRPIAGRKKNIARLFTPFFSNSRTGLCMTFRHIIQGKITKSSGLLVYLLPCHPPYRLPVLNVTVNGTDSWGQSIVPLPDYKRPYQVLFEAQGNNQTLEYVAIDDIVFLPCGELVLPGCN